MSFGWKVCSIALGVMVLLLAVAVVADRNDSRCADMDIQYQLTALFDENAKRIQRQDEFRESLRRQEGALRFQCDLHAWVVERLANKVDKAANIDDASTLTGIIQNMQEIQERLRQGDWPTP